MNATDAAPALWQLAEVASPLLAQPVPVVAARDVPYRPGGNRLQTLNLYLPRTPGAVAMVGKPADALPAPGPASGGVRTHVHIHGGAWRDPQLLAASVEPAVAHAFAVPGEAAPIGAVASLSYTLSHFPTHPTLPYDVATGRHSDPAREAVHPRHLGDVLNAFALLRALGLSDGSYVLTGHSAGACLAFQAILRSPREGGLEGIDDAPCPAAIVGLNGLYDLPALVSDLGPSHGHLRDVYETLLSNAFGADRGAWSSASPARFDAAPIADRLRAGRVPRLVLLDQSAEDQLVPTDQRERLEVNLGRVEGLRLVRGRRCAGPHAAPWERGDMIWNSVRDAIDALSAGG